MNKEDFSRAASISAQLADRCFDPLQAAMKEFSISTPLQQAHFIGQLGHESLSFKRIIENLNYCVKRLDKFGSRLSITQREQLRRKDNAPALTPEQQRAIANIVYGGRYGNCGADDGWRYRGRGLIQITFLDNYRACGRAIGLDLVKNPDLLLKDVNAARSAGWFWHAHNCNTLADAGDVKAITKKVNGGDSGLRERVAFTVTATGILCGRQTP
ncbi:glycoside hydrolase family 19 protein [Pantoea sp. DY-15]|uniref:glycoside hydrolase family 19 protein n=1 Tax=Pantoea sp. DY-15 TaxID=2871489 RepID=UPI001C985443|nr:glycoside hydrolase family 19 protein [Pantoea sp. DY-15]MBY4890715.1 glycoside hydrolase family 19 protein [Pantoea sp. DY-15]